MISPASLIQLGLTDAESQIYLAILRLGRCTVRDISKQCGFHRTNIYDILEQLKEKGLVTFFVEGKTSYYSVSDPQNLFGMIDEKRDALASIFPEILKLQSQATDLVQVEVYKGEEGMKSAMRDIIRRGKPLYMFGVRGQFRQRMPTYASQWIAQVAAKKIPVYGIYVEGSSYPAVPNYHIRILPKELGTPAATFIYDDCTNINIWEPSLCAIVIKSPIVASMYKKHFDFLWRIAKPIKSKG